MKKIDGYENYGITKDGKVWSYKRNKYLKGLSTKKGYILVGLDQQTKSVHRLVAGAYIPNPDNKPQVNHIDGNKANNCVSNLEWATPSENMMHAHNIGLMTKRNGWPKKTVIAAKKANSKKIKCIETDIEYISITDAFNKTGIPNSNISVAVNYGKKAGGYHWQFI